MDSTAFTPFFISPLIPPEPADVVGTSWLRANMAASSAAKLPDNPPHNTIPPNTINGMARYMESGRLVPSVASDKGDGTDHHETDDQTENTT